MNKVCVKAPIKPGISMISGFADVSMSPKTNLIYLGRHQDTPIIQEKSEFMLKHFILGNLRFGSFEIIGMVCLTHLEIPEFI